MRQDKIIQVDANGELQLPDVVMDRHGWQTGSRLKVELIPGGLLLKSAPAMMPAKTSAAETGASRTNGRKPRPWAVGIGDRPIRLYQQLIKC
jgi:hypothetical protein